VLAISSAFCAVARRRRGHHCLVGACVSPLVFLVGAQNGSAWLLLAGKLQQETKSMTPLGLGMLVSLSSSASCWPLSLRCVCIALRLLVGALDGATWFFWRANRGKNPPNIWKF
jgi:hypothetical protein